MTNGVSPGRIGGDDDRNVQENRNNVTQQILQEQLKTNNALLHHMMHTQDYLHAKGKKGFRFSGNPEHFESLVTVYDEKTSTGDLNDTERFNILGSLLEGDAENMYKEQLHLRDKTEALGIVWRALRTAYGYRDMDSLTLIYERSNGPIVENDLSGLKELHKDLIFCMGRVRHSESMFLDNPALVNNFDGIP